MSESQYWTEFWKQHGASTKDAPEQVQVLRTLNKLPIDQQLWDDTLTYISSKLHLEKDDHILDLCCGNGLISKHLAQSCISVTSVDISEDLVMNLNGYSNIQTIASDIRKIDFKQGKFTKVLLYAGVQYLSDSETVKLIERIHLWLKPNGILFLGDVPDKKKIWDFYNSPERRAVYIRNVKNETPIVGNWFTDEFFHAIGETVGFSTSQLLHQPERQIYSKFRFDYKFVK